MNFWAKLVGASVLPEGLTGREIRYLHIIITRRQIIITAGAALVVSNMEAWFSPEIDSPPPSIEQTISIPPGVVKDTLVITKTVIQKPKEEKREIDW